MDEGRVEALKAVAKSALEDGDIEAALDAYQRLEVSFGNEPSWSREVAALHRRLGQDQQCVAALLRASERCSARGEPLKAIAAIKLLLAVAPDHEGARNRLARILGAPPERVTRLPWLVDDLTVDVTATPLLSSRPAIDSGGLTAIPLPDARVRHASVLALPLFSMVAGEDLEELLAESRLVDLPSGQHVFREGDAAESLFVIIEGAVTVWIGKDKRTELARLGDGDFFGEIAVLAERPRTATVTTTSPTELLEISRATIVRLVKRAPQTLPLLLSIFRDRLADVTTRSSPFFRSFDDADRGAIADHFVLVDAAHGHPIITQGQHTRGLFVVVDGTVKVTRTSGASHDHVATLGPGHVFGEISTMTLLPAVATVVMEGRGLLLLLEREDVRSVVNAYPAVLEYATRLGNERMDRLKARSITEVERRVSFL